MTRLRPPRLCPRRPSASRPRRRACGRVVTLLALLCGLCAGRDVPAAGPVYWDYPEAIPFQDVGGEGAAVDAHGRLVPGLVVEELLAGGPEVYWRIVPDGTRGWYAASGHGGQIWRLARGGESSLLATVGEPEVFSLVTAGGYLFAGCGPGGQLYRVDREGGVEPWLMMEEGYIWSAVAREGALYLAVGSPARVYRVDGAGEAVRLADLKATNALDLAFDDDGRLLVVTQGPGLVYSLDPAGREAPRVLMEQLDQELRRLVRGPGGAWQVLALARDDGQNGGSSQDPDIFAFTPPGAGGGGNGRGDKGERAVIHRLEPGGLVVETWRGQPPLLCLAWSEAWGWLGGGIKTEAGKPAHLWQLPPLGPARPVSTWDAGDVLELRVFPGREGQEEILVGLANPGRILRLSPEAPGGVTAVSEPLDGKYPVHWARLSWEGTSSTEGRLRWSVRTGPRATPDETWTDWSGEWTERDHALEVEPTRYLQWRVRFPVGVVDLAVSAVSVSAREPNLPPRIHQFRLESDGEISMGGLMGRDENVTETFPSGLKVEYSRTSRRDQRAGPARAAPVRPLRTFSWLASDPNDDRLEFRLEYRRLDEETWRPAGPPTVEVVGTWDTSEVPDGLYEVRLTASDRPDNPADEARRVSSMRAPLRVDRTPPAVRDFEVRRTETGLHVSFRAEDGSSALAEAWLVLPDGGRERLDPVDGVCDSRRERFDREVAYPRPEVQLPAEPWRLRVEITDRQGNVAVEEGEAR